MHLQYLEKQTLEKLCPHQSPGGPGRLVWRQHAHMAGGDCISVSVAVLTPQGCQLPSFADGPRVALVSPRWGGCGQLDAVFTESATE